MIPCDRPPCWPGFCRGGGCSSPWANAAGTTSSHAAAQGGLAEVTGDGLASVQEKGKPGAHGWKGEAIRPALCLQDMQGQHHCAGGASFSSLNLPMPALALRDTV